MAAHHTQRRCPAPSLGRKPPAGVVERPQEVQAVGREGRRGRVAAARRQHLAHPSGGCVALADAHQAAHDVADHVVQEGVGLELEVPAAAIGVAMPRDVDTTQVLDRRTRLAGRGAEGAEVVSPTSIAAAARIASPSSGYRTSRRGRHPGSGAPATATARRGSAVRARWRGSGTASGTGCAHCTAMSSGRKRLVPRTQEKGARSTAVSKCTTCIRRMHAGIGAAGAERGDGLGGEAAERSLQLVLHGAARGLALPAFVGLAVVADAEGQPHGGIGGRPAAQRNSAEQLLGFGLDVARAFGSHFFDQRAGAFDVAERLQFARQRELDGMRAFAAFFQRLAGGRARYRRGCGPTGRPSNSCRTR